MTRRAGPRVPPVLQRRVGESGLRVSRLGLGTTTWGDDTDADGASKQIGGNPAAASDAAEGSRSAS